MKRLSGLDGMCGFSHLIKSSVRYGISVLDGLRLRLSFGVDGRCHGNQHCRCACHCDAGSLSLKQRNLPLIPVVVDRSCCVCQPIEGE